MKLISTNAVVLLAALLFTVGAVLPPPAWAGEALSRPRTESRNETLEYVLIGSVLALGASAAVCEVESNREYSRYLETADPTKIRVHYDRAERYRALSNASLIGAEACAVGFVIYVLNGKSREETPPHGVRITLQSLPLRAEVSYRW